MMLPPRLRVPNAGAPAAVSRGCCPIATTRPSSPSCCVVLIAMRTAARDRRSRLYRARDDAGVRYRHGTYPNTGCVGPCACSLATVASPAFTLTMATLAAKSRKRGADDRAGARHPRVGAGAGLRPSPSRSSGAVPRSR